jgi:hypothetical protein
MLGDDLRAADGAEVGNWIEPALGCSGAVEDQVPKLFEAYARVFHPASDAEGAGVTWAEVARRLGRNAHPEMQWHQIVGTADTFGIEGSEWSGSIPNLGELEIEDLDRLCAVLARHTADPDHCYFGLCEINHHPLVDKTESEQGKHSRLRLPVGRDHLVLEGPLEAVKQIGDTDPPGLIWFVRAGSDGGPPPERPEPDPTDPFWREAPSLIWPADHSWFVASEVDFDTTVIGGSRALVDALLDTPGLEVFEVTPRTKLTAFSDQLNPLAPPRGEPPLE